MNLEPSVTAARDAIRAIPAVMFWPEHAAVLAQALHELVARSPWSHTDDGQRVLQSVEDARWISAERAEAQAIELEAEAMCEALA